MFFLRVIFVRFATNTSKRGAVINLTLLIFSRFGRLPREAQRHRAFRSKLPPQNSRLTEFFPTMWREAFHCNPFRKRGVAIKGELDYIAVIAKVSNKKPNR
jgi:hypothetical protein